MPFWGYKYLIALLLNKYTLHVVRRSAHNLISFVNVIIWYDPILYKLAAVKQFSACVLDEVPWQAELKS
jgi:hypothetical protein